MTRGSASPVSSPFRPEVRRLLPTVLVVRFAINVSMRMAYTFLPAFARGTGLSVGAMSAVLSARELVSLCAPWAGRLSDRHGNPFLMACGGLVAGVGLLLATLGAPGLVIGLVVFGFGRTVHQVALGAWVGSVIAYERRGRATGLIELTWGGAALVGIPLVGLLIDGAGWRVPFALLGCTAIAASAVMARRAAGARPREAVVGRRPRMSRSAVAALATNGAMTGAAQFLFLGHGLWLEDTYALDTAQVGFAVLAVGAIEVVATLGSSRFTDRLGKRRSMVAGSVLMTLAMVALAVSSAPPLWIGLGLLVVAFLGFEYGIVSAIPLIAELDPGARAGMVGRGVAISTVVRAIGTAVATLVYVNAGFSVLMTGAAAMGAVAVLLASVVMSEPDGTGAG